MKYGTISNWKEEKGFGFIAPESGENTIFFHINNYSNYHKRPVINLKVQYFTSTDRQGRACAVNVTPVSGHRNNGREIRQKIFSLVLFSGFSAMLYYLYSMYLIPLELVCVYAVMSVVTFLMYLKDKSAAEWGNWRTTENTLHLLSMLGGWPGAKLAQSFLRHKSKKVSFRVTYWVTVALNGGALYWLTTPEGNIWLQSIIARIYHQFT